MERRSRRLSPNPRFRDVRFREVRFRDVLAGAGFAGAVRRPRAGLAMRHS